MSIRILHTADWHLKPKHPFTSMEEGAVWDKLCECKLDTLRKLPKLALKYKCEGVLIAGDIFDTSNPPEALKAEVCKIINKFINSDLWVTVINGRPGDHDYVSDKNYVMMDLKEAYDNRGNVHVVISDSNYHMIRDGVLAAHDLVEDISDMYKNTVALSDERFRDCKLILMGDYHSFWKKTYAGKVFIYSGAPYPTRYGETNHSVNIVDADDNSGELVGLKRVGLKTYQLLERNEFTGKLPKCETPFIVKYKMSINPDEVSGVVSELHEFKRKALKKGNCLDVVWEIKSASTSRGKGVNTGEGIVETCLSYIKDNATHPKSTSKLFKKLEALV